MKAPLSWLKEYVDIDVDVDTLCEKLVKIGFEVEEVKYLGEGISNVVVGKILKIEKHPNADKLRICQVDVGKEVVQIITHAENCQVGDLVPVALIDSYLPGGKHIVNGQLRGLDSFGMMCGGDELGINNDVYPNAEVDGIVLLDKNAKIGDDIINELGLNDYVLDVSITSNRPDCGSIYGLAREVAVALGKKCKPIDTSYKVNAKGEVNDFVNVQVIANDLCPNYYMNVISDVNIATSPLWMRKRLYACGLRGINNVVDITNYVLLELGQPMHAFDHNDISENTIIVRRAKNNEKITLLDNKEYTLDENVLVIADKNKAVGLAGIMGGGNSGIKDNTSIVAFEAAKFVRENIRHNSKKLNVRSDSSAHFEKGVDAYTTKLGLDRALHLVNQLDCGKIVDGRISIEKPSEQKVVSFDYADIEKLLGIKVSQQNIEKILNNLHIDTTIENDKVTCLVPKYREDIEKTCDIVEEIIRVYGYDNIKSTLLENSHITMSGKLPISVAVDKTKSILTALGYNEIITYSFGGKALFGKLTLNNDADLSKNIKVMNPLGEELSTMRTTLIANMLDVIRQNTSKNNNDYKLFEYGKTYNAKSLPLNELPIETNTLCFGSSGRGFYEIKENVLQLLELFNVTFSVARSKQEFLHPGISIDIISNDEVIGFVGQIHPIIASNFDVDNGVVVAQIDFDKMFALSNDHFKYCPIPKFPAIDRDFALVVDSDIFVLDLINTIKEECDLCESVEVFDVYTGSQLAKGKKSVALAVRFRGNQTLKDSDIDPQIEKCLLALKNKFSAVLR